MNAKPHLGLGRGLGDLLARTDPDLPAPAHPGDPELVSVAGARFAEIPVGSIKPNPKQPRQVFDEDALAELVDSIREVGLLQPVVVTPLDDGSYELVMGERRLRAATLAGLTAIPAIVRPTQAQDLLRDALMENLHRVQLNPLEEAAAYKQMLDDFGCTQEELAVRVKRSRPQISNSIRLLKLPPQVQRRIAAGVLSAGHARALLVLDDLAEQERLAQRIVAEGLSVRTVEELVAVGERVAKPRTPRERVADPREQEVAEALGEKLDTRVHVTIGKGRGRIVIDFGDSADLDRVLSILKA